MIEEDKVYLTERISIMVDDIIEGQEVLKFRLSALESMLSGTEDIFCQSLIVDQIDLSNLSPVSLGILSIFW